MSLTRWFVARSRGVGMMSLSFRSLGADQFDLSVDLLLSIQRFTGKTTVASKANWQPVALARLAPHTSSPHQAKCSNAPTAPYRPVRQARNPTPQPICLVRAAKVHDHEPTHFPEPTRHHTPSQCLPKSQTSSSSSRSADARMLAVRLTATRRRKEERERGDG